MSKLNRRDFLKVSAAAGASAALASCGGGGATGGGAALPDLTTGKAIPIDQLAAAAKTEGALNLIAIPHDWANYGVAIDTFKAKYGLTVNENNPDAGSADELEAIRSGKGNKGPEVPDTVDVGIGYGPDSKKEGLCSKYFLSTWDSIPVKDPDGYWFAEYYGVLTFEINKDVISTPPADWEDLLKPEYKGKVAMAGDVLKSNESVMTVMASGIARAGGIDDTVDSATAAAQKGLEFWKEVNDAGNFVPVIADIGKIAAGETPVTVEWDYLSLANRDSLKGNPDLGIVVPPSGNIAGPYIGFVSAYAPHPYAGRLWYEFLMSDEGQLIWLSGYAYPIRYQDMAARGVIPADLAAKLPPAEDVAKATFLTLDQQAAVKTYITENWRKVVYGE
jgi:putative spermidine/putrescine transport system substrate-binding protein